MTDPSDNDPQTPRPDAPPQQAGSAVPPKPRETAEDAGVVTPGVDPAAGEPPASTATPPVEPPARAETPPTEPPAAEPQRPAAEAPPAADASALAASAAAATSEPVAATGTAADHPAAVPPARPRPLEPTSVEVVRSESGGGGQQDHHHYPPAFKHLSLPNILTALRCLLVLVVVILLIWPWGPLMTGALIVFGIAAVTDWLDGRLARSFNLISDLGRMLDHIADKLLVGVTLLTLCAIGVIDGLNVLAAALILAREIAISGLREHLAPRNVIVPPSDLGKWKATFQMVAIAALMASPWAPFEMVARVAALLILWAAMVMTLVSGFQYAWGTRKVWSEE